MKTLDRIEICGDKKYGASENKETNAVKINVLGHWCTEKQKLAG